MIARSFTHSTPHSVTAIFAMIMLLIPGMLISNTAQARDDKHMMPIAEAMDIPEAKEQLNPDIQFIFGSKGPAPKRTIGTYTSNRKTNAFHKSDEEACRWVFLSSLLALQDRAIQQGGDAVVNIESYYKQKPVSSSTEYECHAGGIMAGVALRGTVVKLK